MQVTQDVTIAALPPAEVKLSASGLMLTASSNIGDFLVLRKKPSDAAVTHSLSICMSKPATAINSCKEATAAYMRERVSQIAAAVAMALSPATAIGDAVKLHEVQSQMDRLLRAMQEKDVVLKLVGRCTLRSGNDEVFFALMCA